MTRKRRWVYWIPLAILGMALFVALGGTFVMLLWNWLVPGLFGGPRVEFWQAIGVLALSRILFGGFGLHGNGRHSHGRMRRHWSRMTPEERERFRAWVREGEDPGAPVEPDAR